jgi:hypothetical protein
VAVVALDRFTEMVELAEQLLPPIIMVAVVVEWAAMVVLQLLRVLRLVQAVVEQAAMEGPALHPLLVAVAVGRQVLE